MKWRFLVRAVLLAAVITVLAGCGVVTISGKDDMRTLSPPQAMGRVEEHIADAVAALPVQPRLEEQSRVEGLPCDDPTDDGPLGRVTVGKTYWLRQVPKERNTEVFEAIHSYWLSHDYRVLHDWRDRTAAPALFVESNRDAFRMSLQSSLKGNLTLSATSPCVWPNGTPPPEVTGG